VEVQVKFYHYLFLRNRLLSAAASSHPTREPLPSPLVLAYIGDAVFSLYVRERLCWSERTKVRPLNAVSADFVSAVRQAGALDQLTPFLREKEQEVVRSGRNSKSAAPKSASAAQYRKSTGLECLIGWLYWREEAERLEFLLDKIFVFMAEEPTGGRCAPDAGEEITPSLRGK
jgi:ribonuclease-3 family protein